MWLVMATLASSERKQTSSTTDDYDDCDGDDNEHEADGSQYYRNTTVGRSRPMSCGVPSNDKSIVVCSRNCTALCVTR